MSSYFGSEDRPVCPECKRNHINSRGVEWECMHCGRRWVKVRSTKMSRLHKRALVINARIDLVRKLNTFTGKSLKGFMAARRIQRKC